ncbi:anaerobic ribonucleoside triphosphate reductase [Exiguobacterium sp. TBG-PICH-001]|uniref:anaerobic ribonucleoside triphosphate reductase n=1 Tax=Exiguobacterium abrahamii TaxID=2785532 RepID=UPI0018A77699|nr:anaerobic ribonucleoside triphosphate reductase [Exiguobacterium sp. TBG-PICH-001]MBF8153479.1 anaerobic ribonucleoside triphosphate reductase [Exiguobacterium sp. TBG-PICH-001]
MESLEALLTPPQDIEQENANIDGKTPLAKLQRIAGEAARQMMRQHLEADVLQALDDNILYIHDADYYVTGTTTCAQIPLGQLLSNGFQTTHGSIRPAQDIRSALALAAIIVQANQNMQHGGQAFATFDDDLAPFVEKTYQREWTKLHDLVPHWKRRKRERRAWQETYEKTFQACEAFIHNTNSMHSRGGGQVPFLSVNYGTNTTQTGRLFQRALLTATERGLGRGETPIFPIQIFKVKQGVNLSPTDPNYDLFQLATRVTGKRLFPNFAFLDAPFNRQEQPGGAEVAYMGCRTRVFEDRGDIPSVTGRGNLSFTSINLVRLALQCQTVDQMFEAVQETTRLACRQLIARYEFQASQTADAFPFLYQHVWKDGETLKSTDPVGPVLKHGTLAVGFIGLAECLTVLTGSHHGYSELAHRIGLALIQAMRTVVDNYGEMTGLNFSLLATPAEGLSGKFTRRDASDFGEIKGVTDQPYYTNSFHIPVDAPVTIREKIQLEAPFHALCNGGHITYVETDGALAGNPQAIEDIVRLMAEAGIGYGSINHPVDRCLDCRTEQTIEDQCPVCGSKSIERIRRITGYLVGTLDRWNEAKRTEEQNRVKHDATRSFPSS